MQCLELDGVPVPERKQPVAAGYDDLFDIPPDAPPLPPPAPLAPSFCFCPICSWSQPFPILKPFSSHLRSKHPQSLLSPELVSQLNIRGCSFCGVYFSSSGFSIHRPGLSSTCIKQTALNNLRPSLPSPPAPSSPPSTGPILPVPSPSLSHDPLRQLIDLLPHFRLWRRLPFDLWPRWQEICRPALQEYCLAKSNPGKRSDAIASLLRHPQRALIRSRGGASNRGRRALKSQLSHYLESLRSGSLPSQAARSAPASRKGDPLLQRVLRANELVSQGYLAKGVKSLLNDGLSPVNKDVFEALQALHPKQSEPVPDLPVSSPRIIVDSKVLSKLITDRTVNGSSPATSGWTGELLAALIGDPICLEGLTCLVSDICNGDLPESDRALLGSTLISGKKSDGGVRPIAMGRSFLQACRTCGHAVSITLATRHA